jgi:hypothetical protein
LARYYHFAAAFCRGIRHGSPTSSPASATHLQEISPICFRGSGATAPDGRPRQSMLADILRLIAELRPPPVISTA